MSLEKTAKLIFKGDDQASHVMASLGGHLDDFGSKVSGLNQSVADITSPFADLAGFALKAEAAIAAAGAAMVTMAVNQAGKFSDSFAEISTLVTATDAELATFKDGLLDYSRDSKFAFEEINDAVYQAISFGADYTQALDAVATAEKLAIGGKAGLASATELLSGTLNAYGADVDQAGKYSDIFFTIVRDGKTTIPELATNLSKVTGIAAAAGVPMETLGSAIAAITASGAPTSEAITGLKAVISNIIKPTKDASETAELLGIKFNATALETLGLDGMMAKIYKTTGGNVEQMGKLFGSTEALNAALILGADSSGTFARALADMQNATGATDAAYKKMADNIALANQNVINNARATMIDFGTPLLGSYRDLADGIVAIFQGLSISIDAGAFDPVFDELNAQAARAAEFLQAMAEALPAAMKNVDLKGLLESFRDLGKSISNLFEGVDLTSASGLTKAIQAVVDSVEGLTRFSSGIVSGAGPVIKTLVDWAKSFNDLEDGSQKSAGELTGFLAIINQLTGPLDAVMGSIGGISSALNIFASASLVRAITGAGGLTTALANVAAGAGSLITTLTGPAGLLAIVATLAGTEVVRAVLAFNGWRDAEGELEGSLQRGAVATQALADKYAEISKQTGYAITSSKDFHQLLNDGAIALNKQTGEYEKVITKTRDYNAEVKAAKDANWDWSASNSDLVDELGNLKGTVGNATGSLDANKQAARNAAAAYYELQGNTPAVAAAMAALDVGTEKTTEGLKKVEEQTEATTLKLLELASDERIRSMELAVDIKIANIEAEAQKVDAMFASINNTISETSDNIGTLFGLLGDAGSFSDRWAIQDQLEKENDIRDQAAKDQHKLNELQIEQMELRNDQIRTGGSLITVQADGLKPHLELIFSEILEEVQVRLVESQADFLLVS
jgi:TP901 family phage tail tape measure protein